MKDAKKNWFAIGGGLVKREIPKKEENEQSIEKTVLKETQ